MIKPIATFVVAAFLLTSSSGCIGNSSTQEAKLSPSDSLGAGGQQQEKPKSPPKDPQADPANSDPPSPIVPEGGPGRPSEADGPSESAEGQKEATHTTARPDGEPDETAGPSSHPEPPKKSKGNSPPRSAKKPDVVALEPVDAKGYQAALAKLKGKVVVVDFWATWCAPCKKAFPETVKLHGLYGDKGLAVVSMAMEMKLGDKAKALSFLQKQKATFKNLICTVKFFDAIKLFQLEAGIPHYKVYDRSGKLRATYNLKEARKVLEPKLKELMLEKPK